MIRPVKTYSYISTHFGDSPDPGVFGKHAGNDYVCPVGTPIYAPISGTVTSSMVGVLAGGQVEITGDKIHRTLHMSRQDVSVGQKVVEGQQIGLSGNTGSKTTGPHCHWDVRKLGTAWDHSFSDYYDSEVLLKEEGDTMYPNQGDIINIWRKFLKREPNANDIAYWTTGTGNPAWAKGASEVWKALFYALDPPASTVSKQAVIDYVNNHLS